VGPITGGGGNIFFLRCKDRLPKGSFSVIEIFILYILGVSFEFFIHVIGLIMIFNRGLTEFFTVNCGFVFPNGKGDWSFHSGVVCPKPFSSSNCHFR
jgi:hypothetical protein